jgi:superfamily I DNA/RNA helicase
MFLVEEDTIPKELMAIKNIFKKMGKVEFEIDANLKRLWRKYKQINLDSYEKDWLEVSFTDMLYLPIYKDLDIPLKPVYVFADECQDFNLLQHKLFDKLIAQPNVEKWISVGDKNQSIYGFAGALSNSFDLFKTKENVKELNLSVNYRSCSKIIDEANKVYDIMKCHTEEEGLVETITDTDLIKNNSMVICRNAKPLVSVFFSLLRQGKDASLLGNEILATLSRFCLNFSFHTINSAMAEAEAEILKKECNAKTDNDRIELHYYKESFDIFIETVDNLCENRNTKVKFFLEELKEKLKERKASIILCTMHKAKGLEADTVYILDENLIPSKFCKGEDQMIQERNLKYIARSRAKKELYYLNLNERK